MVLLILGAEGFPIFLYLSSFHDLLPPDIAPLLSLVGVISLPLFFVKHFINILQFIRASVMLDEPKSAKAN
jgi:hypothetical protein